MTIPTTDGVRRAMLAKVHIARKELALGDEAYGDVLRRVTGSESARDLTDAQLDRVLAEFRRLGWKPKTGRRSSQKPNVRLIFALWGDLTPHLADPSGTALNSFVKRQTLSELHPLGIGAPEFLDAQAANKVIEGLKAWLARVRANNRRLADLSIPKPGPKPGPKSGAP